MKSRANQTGFSAVELVIVFVVLAVLGFVGYTVYSRQQDKKTTTNNTSQQTNDEPAIANDVPSAPEVNSASDLDKAASTLDQTDLNTSNDADVSKLDGELSAF